MDLKQFKLVEFSEIGSSHNGKFPRLMLCPYCKTFVSGGYTDKHFIPINNETTFFTLAQKCAFCDGTFVATYVIKNKATTFLSSFPVIKDESDVDHILAGCSPRFADLYKQSYMCYTNQQFDLAAMGFRSALECLVKDFAIEFLNIPKDEVIKKSLFQAIAEYLKDVELVKSADVVRMLGNDYTHYQRKFTDHDIETLKDYMDILCALLKYKIKALNPPVQSSR